MAIIGEKINMPHTPIRTVRYPSYFEKDFLSITNWAIRSPLEFKIPVVIHCPGIVDVEAERSD